MSGWSRRHTVLVVLAVVGPVAAGLFLLFGRPVLRHNAEARALRGELAAVVRTVTGAPLTDVSSSVGSAPPGANGGYCWYYATGSVRTSLDPGELEKRLNDEVLRSRPALLGVRVVGWSDGVAQVTGEALGDGGTLDLRCG